MNYKHANLEICKQIINNEFVRGQEISDDLFLVIPSEGYYGYYINPKDCAFSMSKIKMLPKDGRKIGDFALIDPICEIKITNRLNLMFRTRNDTIRMFKNGDQASWVNSKFLKCLDLYACKFYQKPGEVLTPILAVEDGTPVMVILPMRIDGSFDE